MSSSFYQRFIRTYTLFQRGNLTARYIVGLSLLAVLSISLHLTVQYNLSFQEQGLKTLMKARDHSQRGVRIKKELFMLQTIPSTEKTKLAFTEFKKHFEIFTEEALDLWVINGEYNLQEIFEKTEPGDVFTISEIFFSLSKNISDIESLLETDKSKATGLILRSTEQIDNYLRLADEELDSFDSEYSQNLQEFRNYEVVILLVTLLTLVFEAFYIFRPALIKMEEAQKARSDFFSRIGHEIRNPMNSILGMTTLLEEQKVNKLQKEYLFRLRKSAEGLLSFLNNVIEHAGIEQGKVQLSEDSVNIKDLLDEMSSLFFYDLGRKKLGFFITILGEFPTEFTTDYIKLKYILVNLLNNAIKFTESGKIDLELSFEKEGQKINIKLSDTGIGIEKDKVESVFESFTQADSSVRRKYGGTGLGLSIVREYLDLLNGSIQVESELNLGTSFSVQLPVSKPKKLNLFKIKKFQNLYILDDEYLLKWVERNLGFDSKMTTIKKSGINDLAKSSLGSQPILLLPSSSYLDKIDLSLFSKVYLFEFTSQSFPEKIETIFPAISWNMNESVSFDQEKPLLKPIHKIGKKVLVCDDSEENRIVLSTFLKDYYVSVTTAQSGKECIELLDKNFFDYVFLDIQMPELDGLQVIELAQQNPNFKKMKFIAFTAHNSQREKNEMSRLGFSDLLEKPTDKMKVRLLLEKIDNEIKNIEFPSDLEAKIKARILKKRPEFVKQKLEQLSMIKKLGDYSHDDVRTFGHQLKGVASHYDLDELAELGAKLEESSDNESVKLLLKQIEDILLMSQKDPQ